MKPILFNTEMVRAILEGRKTATRRVIKSRTPLNDWRFYKLHDNRDGAITCEKDKLCAGFYKDRHFFYVDGEKHIDAHYYCAPCKPGDVLYVRETWRLNNPCGDFEQGNRTAEITYKADLHTDKIQISPIMGTYLSNQWRPSIHMPKVAARIFLKVTDMKVEQLQDIGEEGAKAEGCQGVFIGDGSCIGSGWEITPIDEFNKIWNSTIKKKDLPLYGWEANPYVWVIKFERCEKPESEG